jgi:hypothetical protein
MSAGKHDGAKLTEQNFLAAQRPRHANCNCPLCHMDKSVIETAAAVLFATNEKREPVGERKASGLPSLAMASANSKSAPTV